ncbi:hypothetical protein L248_1453 [Schleiferilactobacillus shenzhenensis LY-73]|uniref:Uncharacterized protein n=1 Tax=Schleiferilactobacillus shenzhenensis LY-73 TaxID=1231336 RepID=U4TLJ7_9LACO|nr:hypothetical protein L248_1453 [Schleiferilactobacillus shenzhenensis LY-73]
MLIVIMALPMIGGKHCGFTAPQYRDIIIANYRDPGSATIF